MLSLVLTVPEIVSSSSECFVAKVGQRRMATQVGAERKATATLPLFINCVEQESVSEKEYTV